MWVGPYILGSHAYVIDAVDRLADEMWKLSDAIVALPSAALQAQLLLLRLTAGPRSKYWTRGLPLVAGARLAAPVDRDAPRALVALLCDARDEDATPKALCARAALPASMGGLTVGGLARVLPAAARASLVSGLRAGRLVFKALAAIFLALGGMLPPAAADADAPRLASAAGTLATIPPGAQGNATFRAYAVGGAWSASAGYSGSRSGGSPRRGGQSCDAGRIPTPPTPHGRRV